MIGQFHSFDESIRRVTCHSQRRSDVFESLVVQAVDLDDRLAIDFRDTRPFFDLHFMDEDGPFVAGVIMVKDVGKLIG